MRWPFVRRGRDTASGPVEQPEWHRDWSGAAFEQLQAKNRRLELEFGLGRQGRFDYDLETGSLVISGAAGRATAVVQVAGTTSTKAGNWLWAWANPHLPSDRLTDSLRVRAFGEEHGVRRLCDAAVEAADLNGTGWVLAADAVRILDAQGAYRAPTADGLLFLIIKSIVRPS